MKAAVDCVEKDKYIDNCANFMSSDSVDENLDSICMIICIYAI